MYTGLTLIIAFGSLAFIVEWLHVVLSKASGF